ncbi:DUF3093 domain-containing protein [Micromonospora sp. DH15]|nr:DUF3093 domain-containing protein [Micromonospora sp. DH15]
MSRSPAPTSATTATTYAERLSLPWWLWLAGPALGGFLALELWLGAGGLRAWLPFVVLLPATVAALWWLGRVRVAVADAVPLDAAGRREVLGVGADPLAFVVQRPWIAGAVQVVLDDPADPTPFWVVSTRDPVRLAAALLAARDANPSSPA